MKAGALLAVTMMLGAQAAFADTAGGSSGLALAALVAAHSSLATKQEQAVLAQILDGNLGFAWPAAKTISVVADAVMCRVSNVDLSSRSCELTFGNTKVALKGREAHELFATLAEAGAAPEGAAGSSIDGVVRLACTIDPNEIKQKAGGGAKARPRSSV